MITGTNWRVASPYFSRFVHLQLAMRRNHYGPEYGIPADCLDYLQVSRPNHGDGVTNFLSVEARICSQCEKSNGSSLRMRIQQWAIMPSSDTDFASLSEIVDMRICEHPRNSKRDILISLCEVESFAAISSQQTTYQCPRCGVVLEFHFTDIEDRLAGKTRALIITKWFDLGDGIDPKNSLWSTRVSAFPAKDSLHQKVRSVRSRFESQPGQCQKEATLRHKHLLNRENF